MSYKTVDVDMVMLANTLLDYLVEEAGSKETVKFLWDIGYTEDEIYSLAFDADLIEEVIKK